MSYYSQQGYEIFIPIDIGRVDFIAWKQDELIKVQVKSSDTRKRDKTIYYLGNLLSRRTKGTKGGYTLKEVDEFIVITNEETPRAWRIPHKEIYPKTCIMLAANNDNYKPNHNFPIQQWEVNL